MKNRLAVLGAPSPLSLLVVGLALAVVPLAALGLFPAVASAQGAGGVAGSGMGQGQASITTREQVRLSLQGVPGTSGARVAAIGRSVAGRMAQIRQCYESVVSERPTVTGTLRVRVEFAARGPVPNLTVMEDGPSDRALLRCAQAQLQQLRVDADARPGAVIAVMEFTNSASAGAAVAARRAEQAQQVQISMVEGRPTATGGTPDGSIRYTVRGARGADPALVAEGARLVNERIAGLIDCRRRASRSSSPEGEAEITVTLHRRVAPTARVARRITIPGARTRLCLKRAIEHNPQGHSVNPGSFDVVVRFAGEAPVQAATPRRRRGRR